MKNATVRVLKVLLVGGLFALLGQLLAGCDGVGIDLPDGGKTDGQTGPGLGRTDAGLVSCAIPSPTADQPGAYGLGRDTPYFAVIANDSRERCAAFVAQNPSANVITKGIDCDDVADDFRGTTDFAWCVTVVALDGISTCKALQTSSESPSCLASGISTLPNLVTARKTLPARELALCSPAGVFMGWMCSIS
jgi:hypothetical protein